jgi:probable HAF family extracellular repeat protein
MTFHAGQPVRALAAILLIGAAAPSAFAFRYHVQCQDCDLQQSEIAWSGLSINRDGDLVGYTSTDDHAVLYKHGIRTDLGTLGGNSSSAQDLSDAEGVVGSSQLPDGHSHAFYWQDGQMRDLGLLAGAGVDYSSATGINNLGQIVGESSVGFATHCFITTVEPGAVMQDIGLPPDEPANGNCYSPKLNDLGHVAMVISDQNTSYFHGYLLRDGQWTALGSLPPSTSSNVWDLNDLDQVIGNSNNDAFLWVDGAMQDLGVLRGGTDGAGATGINNHGHVVGTSTVAVRHGHPLAGFLYKNGKLYNLNNLLDFASRRWYIERGVDINDDEEIVGVGYLDGQPHTVLLKKAR